MKYYIRMWDGDERKYIYLIGILSPQSSKWSSRWTIAEKQKLVLFDTIDEAH